MKSTEKIILSTAIVAIIITALTQTSAVYFSQSNASQSLAASGKVQHVFVVRLAGLGTVVSNPSAPYITSLANQSTGTSIQHVVIIMMENQEYSNVIGNSSAPYQNTLANQYALATNYDANFHPSLPNYMAITGGSNFGITSDCSPTGSCTTSSSSIFSLISGAGLTWKTYAESMPSNCDPSDSGTSATNYYVDHNPASYYTSITTACNANDVPMGTLTSGNLVNDLNSGSLPNFAMIIPNECDDAHSCPVSTGDTFLSQLVPLIQNSPEGRSTVIFIVYDEGTTNVGGGGHIPVIVVGAPGLVNHVQSKVSYNHYSLLRTVEGIFHLPTLGRGDQAASAMTDIISSA